MVGLILGFIGGLIFLSWAWIEEIDNVDKKHSDYKGENWLGWDEKDHNDIF